MTSQENKTQYSDEIKELVLARLETLPSGAVVSIGSDQELAKEELISAVKEGNEVGQKIIEIEISFLQSLKEGVLYGEISAGD